MFKTKLIKKDIIICCLLLVSASAAFIAPMKLKVLHASLLFLLTVLAARTSFLLSYGKLINIWGTLTIIYLLAGMLTYNLGVFTHFIFSVSLLAGLLLVLLTDKKRPKNVFLKIGDYKKRIGLYTLLMVFSILILSIWIILNKDRLNILQLPASGSPVIKVLGGLVFAGYNSIIEEIIFRAILFSYLLDIMDRRMALVSQALLFGIFHWHGIPSGILGIVLAFIFGLILGKNVEETNGIFMAIVFHFCIDFILALLIFSLFGSV